MRALRTTTRVTATLTAAGVMALAAGPAFAADTTVVAQSEAEAIYLAIGGQSLTDQVGGQYRAERTGQGETTEGNNKPQASLVTGLDSIAAGTLAQDARTGLAGNRGVSEACSGIAGKGSSFVGVGEEGRCLTRGDRAEIKLTPDGLNLSDLFEVKLIEGTPSLDDILGNLPGQPEIDAALDQLNQGIQDALAPLDNAGLVAGFDAITSECTAGPGEVATGDANLADVDITLNLPEASNQDPIPLLELESDPAPNTKLVTQLDEVVDEILDSLLANLDRDELGGLPGQLDPIRDAVKEQILEQIADNAGGPLEENLLDVTLNKQTRAPGEIEVTAIDAAVLPVLQGQAGFNAVDLRLARSQCGPGATLTDTPTTPTDPDSPDVPRIVPAGVGAPLDGTAARGGDATIPAALALLALMTFGSAVGFSTSRSRAGA